VSAEQRKEVEERAQSTWWDARNDMGELDNRNEAIMNRILAERDHIRKCSSNRYSETGQWHRKRKRLHIDMIMRG